MPNFLKNLSLKKTSLEKQIVLIFLLFLIFGLLLPTNSAQAQGGWILSKLGGGAIWIAQAWVGIMLQLTLLLAEGILAIGIALLSGVIGLTLSGSISLTSPDPVTGNPVIAIGWTLIRDFVNIGFILGLVYIGLATALRVAGFELKKVFPWFLIMALLINFTPVICGVVVDAANMVTKFFLGAMANWSLLGEVFSLHMAGLGELFGTLSFVPLIKFLLLIVFGFVAGFVLIVFAVLLLLRMVVIPILVIFSPLAFLAYIFPRTRTYFTQWWNQLLQWSFIGAIGGFFLYLSRIVLREKAKFEFTIPADEPALSAAMTDLAPYFVVILFLMVGLFITLSSSAMGANVVTGFAQKQGMKALKWGGKGAKWFAARATRKGRERWGGHIDKAGKAIGRAGKRLMEKGEAKFGKPGKVLAGAFGGYAVRGLGYGIQKGGLKLGAQAVESFKKGVEEGKKKAKGKSIDTQHDLIKGMLPEQRIGGLLAAIEDENIKDLIKIKGLTNEKIKSIMRETLDLMPSMFKDMRDAFPKMTEEMVGKQAEYLKEIPARRAGVFMDEDDIRDFKTLSNKIVADIKPKKVAQWTTATMQEIVKEEAFHKFGTPAHISAAAETFGRDFLDTFIEKRRDEDWYKSENYRLYQYLRYSPAARNLGIGFPEKEEEERRKIVTPVEARREEERRGGAGVGRARRRGEEERGGAGVGRAS